MKIVPSPSTLSALQTSLLRILQATWGISDRECAILQCLVTGMTATKDISNELNVSTSTINKHIEAICRKAKTQGRFEIISLWLSHTSDLLRYLEDITNQWGNAYISEDDEGIVDILEQIVVQIGYTPVIINPKNYGIKVEANDLVIFDLSFQHDAIRSLLLAAEATRNPLIVAVTGNIPFLEQHADRFVWDRLFLKPFNEEMEQDIRQLAMERKVRKIIAS